MWTQIVILVLIAVIAPVRCEFRVEKFLGDRVPLFIESLGLLHREPLISPNVTNATVIEQWITQKLDHFDEQETRTWQMRYMMNEEHFKEGGPMFIKVGGEKGITSNYITAGHLYDMAKEHNAILYQTEHRYYGESRPTSNMTMDNLKYLHVKQALADLAHFIRHLRETNPALANSKVIMAGRSYSATMTIWFKRLYPDLVSGSWASSAPVFAKVEFAEYFEVVGQAIYERGTQQCYDRIRSGVLELESMFANNRTDEVKKLICDGFDENNQLDKWTLFYTIAFLFAGVVQYQTNDDIQLLCEKLMSYENDAKAVAEFVLLHMGQGCVDLTYKTTVDIHMNTKFTDRIDRQWRYQTCNEYGWYATSGSTNQPFGQNFPLTLPINLCSDIFERSLENIETSVAQTNKDFGGMNPEVERVYVTHGGLDPWNRVGLGIEQGAFVIPNASHAEDFASISDDDSDAMRQSKERLANLVRVWLEN